MRFILGKETPEWTSDETPLTAFEEFGKRLSGIEERIVAMNKDGQLKNRVGPVNMPCTLLYPTSEDGLTGKEFQTVSQSDVSSNSLQRPIILYYLFLLN
ncbi:hypothetical protein CRYUN_Cryun09bG0182400 [Craigia yunnanensis]